MAQILWHGNHRWDDVWNGRQPWDREITEKRVPGNAVPVDRPADIVKASTPCMILPGILCFMAVWVKTMRAGEFLFDWWFVPLSFVLGFAVAMPLHEFLHAICYPKDARVYIGVCLKQLRAYAASAAALSRERYILMSLAPALSGLLALTAFLLCPVTMKWLMTLCVVPSFMGLLSPAPDYMDVIILLRQVPKGAMIQATASGLVWYR